jgi:hypothetical protein
MMSEGAFGEGRVVLNLAGQAPIELGWDAFSNQASRLAWLLNVPYIDPAARTTPTGLVCGTQEGSDAPVYKQVRASTVAIVIVIVAGAATLLFGPLIVSLIHSR